MGDVSEDSAPVLRMPEQHKRNPRDQYLSAMKMTGWRGSDLVGQPRFVVVALDVIVIGTVTAIVHVHGNDTVGVIGSH